MQSSRSFFPVSLSILAVFAAGTAGAQVLRLTKITDWDGAVRGTGDAPALHGGMVAFYGHEAASSATGVFTTQALGGGAFRTIARVGEPVPNHPGRTFGNFDNPSTYGGRVAFTGGWGSDSEGLYLSAGAGLDVLVDYIAGDPRPRFTFLGPEGVAFEAQDAYETPYFFPLQGGGYFRLAERNEPAPGGGTFATFSPLPRRGASFGGGLASFTGYVNHATGVNVGVYTNDVSTDQLGLIANWNTPMPGQAVNFEYFNYSDTDGEQVAFLGSEGYIYFGGHAGVYAAPVGSDGNGPFTLVAQIGDPAPGSGVPFEQFGQVAVDDGLIVFAGYLDSNTQPNHGLYGYRDGVLFKIIDNGDALFGRDAFDFIFTARGLDRNQLVFRARYIDPNGPYGLGYGLYVATLDGGLSLLGPTTLPRGTTVTFEAVGAAAGEQVLFVLGLGGFGHGWCGRGVCLDLLDPIMLLAGAIADGQGLATLPVFIPQNAPAGVELGLQTVVLRAAGGPRSLASNTLAVQIGS